MRALGIGVALALAACSGPYAGKAEKLRKMPKSAEPEPPPVAAEEIKFAEECPEKFQEEPKDGLKQHNRNASASKLVTGNQSGLAAPKSVKLLILTDPSGNRAITSSSPPMASMWLRRVILI